MPLYNARIAIAVPMRIAFSSQTWTDMPSALTEYVGSTAGRVKFDLAAVTQARVYCRISTAGAAAAEVRVQYSTDESTWSYLDGSAGPTLAINTTGTLAGAWVTLAAAARADVVLRFVGISGDAAADPVFANFGLHVR